MGLLISPISWSHHWILLPAMASVAIGRAGNLRSRWVPGGSRWASVVGYVALAVALFGPNWFLGRAELERGLGRVGEQLLSNSMVLTGIALLALAGTGRIPQRPNHAWFRPSGSRGGRSVVLPHD